MYRSLLYGITITLFVYSSSPEPNWSTNNFVSEISFRKNLVDPLFVSEGIAIGDVNKDGKVDVMAGCFWYEAPSWKKHPLHADTLNAIKGYSTSFINFSLDVNNDGWIDLIRFDQPGANCMWYENPKNKNGLWTRHMILATAGIESPALVDVDRDGKKDIICNDITTKEVVWLKSPTRKDDTVWKRTVISREPGRATHQYTHGLGWGDINKDGLNDIITKGGWWESPSNVNSPDWKFHSALLGEDCANMFVMDVDSDGDNDVLSSSAHNYGLWWHEQQGNGWVTHEISKLFSQSHALGFADINSDGYPDLISGKRYLAHLKGDPGTDDPSVLYWFEYVPGKIPKWIPHLIDDASGVGNNFTAEDVNKDGLTDIIVSNKKGVFVFEQKK